MSFFVSVIGIDGSGKSTITPSLARLVSAEFGLTTVAVGDHYWGQSPTEDLRRPDFTPAGQGMLIRLEQFCRRWARTAVASRRLYPLLKLGQLTLQTQIARQLAQTHQADVTFTDGNLLLSAAGRAINYAGLKRSTGSQTLVMYPADFVQMLHHFVFSDDPDSPELQFTVAGLKLMRWLRRLDQHFRFNLLRLPDAVIFLDVTPEVALDRLRQRSAMLDPHENLDDLSQARLMYHSVVDFFRRQRGDRSLAVIDSTHLNPNQTLTQAIEFLHRLPLPDRSRRSDAQNQDQIAPCQLGIAAENLSKTTTVLRKIITPHYLGRCLLPNLGRSSGNELVFPVSTLGRQLLREGYSAAMMKGIYLQSRRKDGLFDRIFLQHPLHQAIYRRWQNLNQLIERELTFRLIDLPAHSAVKVLTAPSGYALDLFHPLRRLLRSGAPIRPALRLTASDLDADGLIGPELTGLAHELGLHFTFIRGDLTTIETREQFKHSGPYDLILFVGLSDWIAKPDLIDHLKLIRRCLLAPAGVLILDCFTPQAYSLSGHHIGYRVSYYTPAEMTTILTYCGFDPAHLTWQTEPGGINHICLARLPIEQRISTGSERHGDAALAANRKIP